MTPISSNNSTDLLPNTSIFETMRKWTFRGIVACFVGYYSLGYLYSSGLLSRIDRIAIDFFLRQGIGYAGIGAIMPTFQWYSAKTIQVIAGIVAAFIYDLVERIIILAFHYFCSFLTPVPEPVLVHIPEPG